MLRLIYATVRSVVAHFQDAVILGAAPSIFLAGFVFCFLRLDWPTLALWLTGALFMLPHTMYSVALHRRFLLVHLDESYAQAMGWDRRKTEFLAMSSLSFVILGFIAFFFADSAASLLEFSWTIDAPSATANSPEIFNPYREQTALLLFFGSRAIAAIFALLALFCWTAFLRCAIKLSAVSIGYHLDYGEARLLTSGRTAELLSANLIINGGLVTAMGIAHERIAPQIIPFIGEPMLSAAAAAMAYWILSAFNIALWSAMYERYTADYSPRPEIF